MDESRLQDIVYQFDELTERLCDPELLANPNRYREAAQQRSGMEAVAGKARSYLELAKQLDDIKKELEGQTDSEMVAMFREEIHQLQKQIE